MSQRILAAVAICAMVFFASVPCHAQASEAPQDGAASEGTPAQKILEKDPEFRVLLDPPTGDEFLQAYSQGYRDKAADIESKAGNLTDEKLRAQYRSDEWSYVPKKTFDWYKAQADAAYFQAKITFLRDHRDSWVEIGQVKYDEIIKALLVKTLPGAATESNLRLAMNPDNMNQIYEKFRKVTGPDIDDKTRAFVSKAAPGSMCAGNREWCYSVKRDEVEQTLRAARMILVGQGDLKAKRIDRFLLVDYVTETILQEFDPHPTAADKLTWRLSTEVPPMVPPKPPEPAAQAQETLVVKAEEAPVSVPPSASLESVSNAQSSLFSKKPEVRRPVKVTPAAAIDQPPPSYPEGARAKNVQGKVILQATVGKDGSVSNIHVLFGDDQLAPPAVEAVSHWRYKPMLVDGEPRETQTTITLTFSLNN